MKPDHNELIEAMADAIDRDLPGMVFSDQVVEGLRAAAERGWVLANLPERLDRDQAGPICELTCVECHGDCDCSSETQQAWRETLKKIETIDIGESE